MTASDQVLASGQHAPKISIEKSYSSNKVFRLTSLKYKQERRLKIERSGKYLISLLLTSSLLGKSKHIIHIKLTRSLRSLVCNILDQVDLIFFDWLRL